MKQAEALRRLLDPDVEPDRAVEGRLLLDEQVRELVGEGLQRPASVAK